MEVPALACPASPARDQPAPASAAPGAAGGQASPRLTLGPVILPPEQGLAPAVFLKALPIPLSHTVPPGSLQPRAPLVAGSLEGGSVPFILSPLLQPEGPGPAHLGKPAAPTLTVNIVGALPVLSPGLGPALGSLGKVRNAGKYLCPHCGRDCLKPSVLEKHIRSHTGERPFPCTTCGIAFKTQSNLYKHRRTQTHLNNSRLSSESDGAGGSILEEGDKAGETPRAAGKGDSWSQGGGDGTRSEKPLSPGVQGAGPCLVPTAYLSPVTENRDLKPEAAPCPRSTFADREAPSDSAHMASPGRPAAGPQPRRKLPEQTSPPGSRPGSGQQQQQQQQATSSEKPWEARASEGRLRKCESTDSGYLSRSDSAEQPLAPCSPLHSLSEHSAESEGEGAAAPGGGRAQPGGRAAGLELEKRQLEERIARLISHNQAVVDDPQLDNVRPRKTVLCKQGSLDLPVPYTFKDSFHFEIRAPEPGRRRRGALCAARSACTPLGKARPLFFHSVPTQLSTAAECIPVTRSNSLPFVEGARVWREPPDPQDAGPRRQKPLSPRPAPARPVDGPSGHPRALVRQAAVEDLLCPPSGDAGAPAEDLDGKGTAGGDGTASKGKAASRKCGQRKLKMFSQEKWQVYGDETFKRVYQKGKGSRHGGMKAREAAAGGGTALDLPLQEEAAGCWGASLSQAERAPVCGDTSVGTPLGPGGSPLAAEAFSVTEPPKQNETAASTRDSDQPRVTGARSPPTLSCRERSCLGSKTPSLPPDGRLELGCQLAPAPGPLRGGELEAPRPVLSDPPREGGACCGGGTKERCQRTQTVPRRPGGSAVAPQPTGGQLPSERKKLRVEALSCQEPSGPLGAGGGTPGGPEQAASPPFWDRDSDPGDEPWGLYGSANCMARGRPGLSEASGDFPTAPSVALRPSAPRDQEAPRYPAAVVPGCPSQLASQPRAPDGLAAPADTSFPPKYLLRLPQGEARPPAPGAQGPGQGQDPARSRGQPEEPASCAGSGLGTPPPPGAASGPAPAGADGFGEDPNWPRPRARSTVVQGEERGGLSNGTPAAAESPGLTAGPPGEMASFPHTPACGEQRSETHDAGRGPGSTWASARHPGRIPSPWAPRREAEEPPEPAPKVPPAAPPAGRSRGCSLRPGPFPSAPTPSGWPALALCPHAETPGDGGAEGRFPSLRTEPRLTWCCLSRSLPLPTEQKEKAASVYLALHAPGGSPPDEGPDAPPFSHSTAGVTSEPEWKKRPSRRRATTSRGSGRQKTLSVSSRRYRGSVLQSRVQLRAGRLRKPLWVLRKDWPPPPRKGPDPHGILGRASSETAGLNLHLHRVTSGPSLGCGNREEEEEASGPASRSVSPSMRSRPVGDGDAAACSVKGISPPADEHGACRPQNAAVRSGSSRPLGSCVAAANVNLLSCGKGLDVGPFETQLLPRQEQVPADPKLSVFLDAPEPSSLESEGNSARRDVTTAAAAICVSPGVTAGHTALGIHSAEPQGHGRAGGDTLTQSSLDREAVAEGLSPEPRISEQAAGVPETPSRTARRRGLEGTGKQTGVELSDTSSDDEDRLVIEL
ncbi:zinc finger protein 831 [Pteropus medius]|uniref:zinc finger protein 831 n=1 Tax=Pteropus vampyrus TaxID=132908 RepID=UPI00196B8C32|nr:zinc finger protein 831 [Pteropus giganteus]